MATCGVSLFPFCSKGGDIVRTRTIIESQHEMREAARNDRSPFTNEWSVPQMWESNRLTTLKTVSMYLRAAKTEAEEAGESTDGMASSISVLRDEILDLTGQKVDIQIDEDTFKSPYKLSLIHI